MLQKKPYEDDTVIDKILHVAADATLTPRDLVVRPSASPATGAITITLCNVSECMGKFVSIRVRDADATNTVTIQDQDESEQWTDITMNGPGDSSLLYSDGYMWHTCCIVTTGAGTTAAPTTA
jgi:hypothetical protein